jgi:putative ABC transport system permease protein
MFSVMHAVLWRPLPYPQGDRLVLIDADVRGAANAGVAPGELRDLREHTQLFERVASIVGVDAYLDLDGQLERLTAASVSNDLLELLGAAPPALGRTLDSRIDEAIDPSGFWSVRSIVVSDAFRRRWFPDAADVVGRHVRVNNLDVQIVGVLPPDFRVHLPAATNAAEQIDIWFPAGISETRGSRGYPGLARLKPGVSLAQAQAELDTLAAQFVRDFPNAYQGGYLRLHVRPLQDVLTGNVRPALWALAAAVGFVLLISCVNVANLMLARSRSREREIALRRALGGTRLRVVRQLFTENLLLVVLGAAAGLAVAAVGVDLLDWLRPAHLPRQSEIAIDRTAALYTVALSAVVGLLFGLLPALRLPSREHAEPLRAGRTATLSRRTRRLQRGLVVAEVALSIVPLVAAGLMLRTFVNLTQAPLGFDPSGLLTARMSYSFRAFPDMQRRWPLHRDAMERLRDLPGVEAVSAVNPVSFGPMPLTRRYAREGDPAGPQARATMQTVMPGYFGIAGIRVRGRDFTDDDITARRPVVVVDERLAGELWPDGAIGQRLVVEQGRTILTLEVIGVTNPVRVTRVRDDAMPHVFLPFHLYMAEMTLVMKTRESAASLSPAIKHAVESLGTTRPVSDIRPMTDYVDRSVGDVRFTMLVLTGFALAALLLATVGLYGTMAYLTSQRRHEFGVRMALGASAGQVLRSVAGEGLVLAGVGAAIGFAGAMAATDLLRGLLYNVTPFDGVTLLGAVGVVGLTALVAASHPAWRAARINPTRVLREAE